MDDFSDVDKFERRLDRLGLVICALFIVYLFTAFVVWMKRNPTELIMRYPLPFICFGKVEAADD
jgi:uncharacterized iron-regulated membrane protein